jgi:transcriptional regulator with XRE-family HTH domain
MNERGEQAEVQNAVAQPRPPEALVSAGAMLRKAREAKGLHIAALAVTLKVPVKKIEALEADRFSELPDLVFARALASSICRTLRIAPGPVLDRLPELPGCRIGLLTPRDVVPGAADVGDVGLAFGRDVFERERPGELWSAIRICDEDGRMRKL